MYPLVLSILAWLKIGEYHSEYPFRRNGMDDRSDLHGEWFWRGELHPDDEECPSCTR